MSEPALAMDRTGYRYEEAESDAVIDLTLSVTEGEWVGVVGPTNAGKSTLCLLAMGLAPHFFGGRLRGSVTVFGRDSRSVKVAERSAEVGLLFQNPFTQVSGARERVDEEIAFGPECHGLPLAEVDERVEEAIRLVGLDGLAGRHPMELSGGQLQRLALASLLAMRPRLLLLDEPTSQLDPAGTSDIFAVLADLHSRGLTIVMVEQRLEKLCELCPRIIAMAGGRLLADGSPERVFNDEAVAEVVGLPAYTRLAREAGLPKPWPVSLLEAVPAFEASRA
ncbi:MAG: energy-coupling factor ABC transporter ATP-binding protein [Candidatus Dormibacteraeota bacterium]|jgi:energy-coupling factor transporter ATP-binding protein EcfA2|nr:energy-coupling factor ABC transporter ATP-binding protein [Candidatus Dormibacteraeota bacterium]